MNLDEMTPKDARAHLEAGKVFQYTTEGGTLVTAGKLPWTKDGYAISYEGSVIGAYGYVLLTQGLSEFASLDKWTTEA